MAVRTGRENSDGFSRSAEPRMAVSKAKVRDDAGAPVESFGTVVGLRLAGTMPVGDKWLLSGQAIPILSGNNSFDDTTGNLEKQVV